MLIHSCEVRKTSNTGHLVTQILKNSELFVHGRRNEPNGLIGKIQRDGKTFLLFPDESAKIIDPEFVKSFSEPITLIVPDGNWKQARKMTHTIPELMVLPRVKIADPLRGKYRLRRAPYSSVVCTIEAVARALGVLEGSEIQSEIERIFEIFMDRVTAMRFAPVVRLEET